MDDIRSVPKTSVNSTAELRGLTRLLIMIAFKYKWLIAVLLVLTLVAIYPAEIGRFTGQWYVKFHDAFVGTLK